MTRDTSIAWKRPRGIQSGELKINWTKEVGCFRPKPQKLQRPGHSICIRRTSRKQTRTSERADLSNSRQIELAGVPKV